MFLYFILFLFCFCLLTGILCIVCNFCNFYIFGLADSDNLVDKKSGDAVGTFESTRFEYANRVSSQLLKRFKLASDNPKRFDKLITVAKADGVKVENN